MHHSLQCTDKRTTKLLFYCRLVFVLFSKGCFQHFDGPALGVLGRHGLLVHDQNLSLACSRCRLVVLASSSLILKADLQVGPTGFLAVLLRDGGRRSRLLIRPPRRVAVRLRSCSTGRRGKCGGTGGGVLRRGPWASQDHCFRILDSNA